MAALAASELRFHYPNSDQPALDSVSFSIEEGQFAALLGPNGAGKTTLVHLIAGLLRADTGSLELFGQPLSSRAARRLIGFCPQELALYSTLSATENLSFFGKLAGLTGGELRSRIAAVLEAVRLTDQANHRVERYSGGMKRRLNLAIAILAEPKLLILDEPTVGVDAQSRLAIFEALEAQHSAGTTVLYTTHYMEEVERMCREVIVIDHGRLLAQGPTEEIATIGANNTLHLELEGDAATIAAELVAAGHAAKVVGEGEVALGGRDLARELEAMEGLAKRGLLRSFRTRRPTLEERFLELTGEELRDA